MKLTVALLAIALAGTAAAGWRDLRVDGSNEQAAALEQREYTVDEFYRQLDGLRYEEVVSYTDPTGDTAKERYRRAPETYRRSYVPTYNPPYHPPSDGQFPRMPGYPEVPHGGTDLGGSGQR